MDYLVSYAVYSVGLFALLFLYYASASMLMRYARSKPKQNILNFLAKAFVVPFILFDALVNIFIVSVWFLELPGEWLVTTRLKKWRKAYENNSYLKLSWIQKRRLLFAVWLCDKHLDKYDLKGDHC